MLIKDVVYSKVRGYWSEAPSSRPIPVWSLLGKLCRCRELELKMDIYTPDLPGRRPLLLMMHGGAYMIGNKEEKGQVEWCRHFASLGYVAASIDYRLGLRPGRGAVARAEKEAVEDAAAALTFLLQRDDVDPERVFVAGTSAGGAIALSLAYDPPSNMPPCRIKAVGNLWGYVHDLGVLGRANVPIFSFQSEKDPMVPYDEGYPLGAKFLMDRCFGTLAVHRQAQSLGIVSEHHSVPEKGHRLHLDADDRLTPRFFEIRELLSAFFAEV